MIFYYEQSIKLRAVAQLVARMHGVHEVARSNRVSPTMKILSKSISENKAFVAISAFFLVLYSLLSLIHHFNFRTTSWDLGIFNQALYQYAHLKFAPNTVMNMPNMLADHFELTMILVSPFYYIFGSYTLLVFQIIMVIFGGTGVYSYLIEKTKDKLLSLGGATIFYCFYGVFAAIMYDYHNNTIGIMFLPWILLALLRKKLGIYYLLLFLMIFSKENLALIAFFLGFYILLFEERSLKKHGFFTMIIGFVSLELIINIFIPYFNNGKEYTHWLYKQLGSGPIDAIKNITTHPIQSISILFNDKIKLNSWAMFGVTGGLLAIFHPLALMFVPILASKYFSILPFQWNYGFQYSVELAPILAISLPLILIKAGKYIALPVLLVFIFLNLLISTSVSFSHEKRITDLFKEDYYYNGKTKEINEALKLIPAGVSLSVENTILPHVANRDEIYQFPIINNADFIIINHQPIISFIPIDEYDRAKNELKNNPNYVIFYKSDNIEIYIKQMISS